MNSVYIVGFRVMAMMSWIAVMFYLPTLLSVWLDGYVITKDELVLFSMGTIICFGLIIYKIATLKNHISKEIK